MSTYFNVFDEGSYYRLVTGGYNLTFEKNKIEFLNEAFLEWLEKTSKTED